MEGNGGVAVGLDRNAVPRGKGHGDTSRLAAPEAQRESLSESSLPAGTKRCDGHRAVAETRFPRVRTAESEWELPSFRTLNAKLGVVDELAAL